MDEMYNFGELYLTNQIGKPSHSYVKVTINQRPMTIPTVDSVRLVSEDGFNFRFDPDLSADRAIIANQLYKVMLSESHFESDKSNYMDTRLELIIGDQTKFGGKIIVPYTKLSLGAFLLADLTTHLAPRLLLEPKLKYIATNKNYVFINSNEFAYQLYDNDDTYAFALQFKIFIAQWNQSVDFIVARLVKPYISTKKPQEDSVGELEFNLYRYTIGWVYDGNRYFVLDYGSRFMPFNGDYEFGVVMPLSLDILKVSELSPELIDDICTKAAKRR